MALERLGGEAFDGERFRRPGLWAVVFLADWCPFCRAFAPTFESLGGRGSARVAMADATDESSPLWEQFSIDVVPTVIVFRDGTPVLRRDGRLGRGLGDADVAAIRAAMA
ncbi:MAG TPA: thioredoxin family protein [Thermoplasmata archaeon]|nr:thioredoxin family protein [Thermoplasmata archaeon]